jgi:hypothetical protein
MIQRVKYRCSVGLLSVIYRMLHKKSIRSPFVTWMSQCAQSGRWSSFGKRVRFTESNIVFVISFYLLFYLLNLLLIKFKKYSCCIKLNNQIISYQNNALTCTPSLTPLVCDWLLHWIASVRCPLLTLPRLNLSPYNLSYLSPTVPEHTLTDHL